MSKTNLKLKIALSIIITLCLSNLISAQVHSSFHQEFNKWKANILAKNPDKKGDFFFLVTVERFDPQTTLINFGIENMKHPYEPTAISYGYKLSSSIGSLVLEESSKTKSFSTDSFLQKARLFSK